MIQPQLPVQTWCNCDAMFLQGLVSGIIITIFGVIVPFMVYQILKRREEQETNDDDDD